MKLSRKWMLLVSCTALIGSALLTGCSKNGNTENKDGATAASSDGGTGSTQNAVHAGKPK